MASINDYKPVQVRVTVVHRAVERRHHDGRPGFVLEGGGGRALGWVPAAAREGAK